MAHYCRTFRWLSDCQRDQGAHPSDPACTGYIFDAAMRDALATALAKDKIAVSRSPAPADGGVK